MDTIINNFQNMLKIINPLEVSWNQPGEILLYIITVLIFFGLLAGIIYSIFNIGQFIKFGRNTLNELKKVTWLNKELTYKYTGITIVAIILSTFFIILADQTFLVIRGMLISSGI